MNLLFIKTSLCLLFVNVISIGGQSVPVPSCLKTDNEDHICESPGYPNNYAQGDCVCEFTVPNGYQITVLIQDMDLDSSNLDYVSITGGGSDDKIYKYSWSLSPTTQQPTSFVVNKPKVIINFHASKDADKKRGFKIFLKQYGELSTTEEVTTENILPTPVANDSIYYTIYLDVLPSNFERNENQFKSFMLNITEQYIEKHQIEVSSVVTVKNIKIRYAKQCFIQWPNSDHCTEVMYAIPIALNLNVTKFELTSKNLEKMWNEFGQKLLKPYTEWREYKLPNNDYNMILWLGLSLIILIVFLSFLFFMKVLSFRLSTQFQRRASDTNQIIANSNRNSDASLWPMASQIVPPLFDNERPYVYYEPDSGQHNSSLNSQLPSSHTNKAMMCIDDMSDDEILTVPNRSGNNPNQKPIIKFDIDTSKESAL